MNLYVVAWMTLWEKTAGLFVCLMSMTAAEPALEPVPACEAVTRWKDYNGKPVAVLGRYSFRESGRQQGRWLDQDACEGTSSHALIRLAVDQQAGPKPPDSIAIDEPALEKKMAEIRQHTTLVQFRFGSADYDRWAVVLGRLEKRSDDDYQLTYRGDGAVFFLADR